MSDFQKSYVRLLKKYRFAPNPKLDQHFLMDEDIIKEIIAHAEIKPEDIVVEVGAGLGTITGMLPKARRTMAIEIDPVLAEILRKEYSGVEVLEGNALKLLPDIEFTKLISSTPYSICEPLFHELFVQDFIKAVLLLPRKFVTHLGAHKSTFSIFTKAFLKIKKIRDIEREVFDPVPDTDTVLITVEKNKKASLAKELYLQRDKLLKNELREILISSKGLTKKKARELVSETGLPGSLLNEKIANLNAVELKEIIEKTKLQITKN